MAVMETDTGGNPYLDRAYALARVDEARALYDEWADSYDADLDAQGYVGPRLAAEAVARVADVRGGILDAGCGTGLVGSALRALGATVIDGVDISPGMLARAGETGAYRTLRTADLSQPLSLSDESYGVVVCVGTFTHGHVGPEAIGELVRVIRKGGALVATVLDDIWESGGYRAEVERLAAAGIVEIVSTDVVDYRKELAVTARMVILRRQSR